MRLVGEVYSIEWPAGLPKVEWSWRLLIDGKRVGRSENYFATEEEAETDLNRTLGLMPGAPVSKPSGCKTCVGWKPSPSTGMTLTCRDCGRVV